MKFKITHTSEYSYSDEVFFEPHYFRFKPKQSIYSSLVEYSIKILPTPIGFSEQIDIENNHVRLCWFENTHKNLIVTTNSIIDVTEYNPLDFLVHPQKYLNIPFEYDPRTSLLLSASLQATPLSKEMEEYLNNLLQKTNAQSVNFLTELTKQIHQDFISENRDTGKPLEPALSFSQKKGSCRDLAWMQIQFLRHLGIASRFVSGYFYLQSDTPEYELHAWVEAFLPGAGWIGFDPSHGIITTCYHIPLASSSYSENTMPVSGSIRGSASSELKNDLKISIIA